MSVAEDAPVHRLLTVDLAQPATTSAPFGTDAGWLSRLGLDCVIWGPGSIAVAHKPNEWMPIDEFRRGGELLTRVVHRACVEGAA